MCIFTQVRVISISIPYPYPFLSLPTYLPTKRSSTLILSTKKSKLYRSLFLIIPPRPARACAYVYVLYELMERFSSLSYPVRTSPRPSAPLPPKKKKTFASAASPPPPPMWWFITHTVTTRQDKASYLPACKKKNKKKIRNPPSDNVTMLSNPRWITIEGAGLSVCLSTWSCLSGLVLSGLSYLQYGPRTYTRTPWSFEGLSLFFYIEQCLQYIPKVCLVCLPGLVWSVWTAWAVR